MAEPQWLEDIRRQPDIQRSRRAMYDLIREFGLTIYEKPSDRRTYLDPDEVRKALAARPRSPRSRRPAPGVQQTG